MVRSTAVGGELTTASLAAESLTVLVGGLEAVLEERLTVLEGFFIFPVFFLLCLADFGLLSGHEKGIVIHYAHV